MVKRSHRKGPSARSTFVCGMAATCIAQGCATHDPSAEQLEAFRQTVQDGREKILPVVEEFSKIADEDKLFGFDGQQGSAAFSDCLNKSADRLDEIADAGNIKVVYDPEHVGAAFYTDHDGKRDSAFNSLDSITYNEYYVEITDPEKEFVDPDGRSRATYGLSLHETSHDWSKHSKALEDYQKRVAAERPTIEDRIDFEIIVEQDPSSFIGIMTESVETHRERGFINEYEMSLIEQRVESGINNVLNWQEDGQESRAQEETESLVEFIEIVGTPEGYANYIHGPYDLTAIEYYWEISDEEQIRIISETGWFEDYREERIKELESETRHELGLEFREGELRNIDLGDLSEWRAQMQIEKQELRQQLEEHNRELDGYAQQEMRGGEKRL